MQLDLAQIRAITCGAVSVEQENQGICFYRFTKEQYELYRVKNEGFYKRGFSTAGVKLSFRTDSKYLRFAALFEATCLRRFFSVDVYVNGTLIGNIDNYSDVGVPEIYSTIEFPMGNYSGEFDLGEGEKTVVVHMPWNIRVYLQELCLDDGSFCQPVKPGKVLLAFGDSITHGFDALHPSKRYIALLADALNAQEFNKAIGGERYYADLAGAKDALDPDYIVVAYGTNDWRYSSKELFVQESTGTLQNLTANYPQAKIFVISPIWRKIYEQETAFSSFFEIDELLREEASDLPNVTVIKGFDFVPKESRFFADGTLHPKDEGFAHYFENLWREIKELL